MPNQFNIHDFIRPSVIALKPYASARDEFQGKKNAMVFLDANENPFENGINRYPDPYQMELKSVISNMKGISVQNMLLGNGSDEILDLIIRMSCEPNRDKVIILPPTYGMYEVLANINSVKILKIELNEDFQPQVEEILNSSDNATKVLFLCSPNNPSGNNLRSSDVEELISNFNGLVVIDEAYIDFSNEPSWLSRLSEFPNLIITQTLSKAYGMAGIRLGICFASSELISVLNKIKPPYNINQLTQQKAIETLSNKEIVTSQVAEILKEKSLLITELRSIGFVEYVYETDTNFILVKVDDANKRYNQLIDKGIVIRNRTNEPQCLNCLRITVGTSQENQKLLIALKSL